jgi:nucleotide-binding universal stress UspA family protein
VETINLDRKISIRNILYATDFSRYSDAALPFALSLAGKYKATVLAAHVISLSPFPKFAPTQGLRAIRAQALREAQQSMKRLDPYWNRIPHETLIRSGDVWTELSKIVAGREIDLIVTGTHGRTGVSKVLMGSVAESILRHSPCPVLTVGPNFVGEPESIREVHTILFPTDFTRESVDAVRYAVSLAHENQARLYLLHVTAEPVSALTKNELLGRLHDLIPTEAELSCAPKAFVECGTPSDVIADLAEELTVDLIVLGPRRSPAAAGSTHLPTTTTSAVLSRAICPVLTVHKSAAIGTRLP